MKLAASSVLAVFVLLSAPDAFAQDAGAAAEPPDAICVDRAAPRVRFDLAGTFTAGEAQSSMVDSFALGPGLAIDLGAQFGDHAAVYARAEVSTIFPFTLGAAGYVVAEWTPARRFSVGSGLGFDTMLRYCQGCRPPYDRNPSWTGVSFPLLLALNLGRMVSPTRATRRALRLGIEGAGGYEAATNTVGWHSTLSVGVAWM